MTTMRKLMIMTPTWILGALLLYGTYLGLIHDRSSSDWLAYTLIGQGMYTTVSLFVVGLIDACRGKRRFSRRDKLFYGYLLVVITGTIAIALALVSDG